MVKIEFCVALVCGIDAISCIDEAGSAVDWWFLSKHPDGAFYSMLSSKESSWMARSALVTDTSSLLGQQMLGIYDGTVPNYVFYNDQTPDGKYSTTYGHSKGFFAYDQDSAFWVQHSIPDFPNYFAEGYRYGTSQEKYGQHAFCMSLSPSSLNSIAGVMKYSNGWIFDHEIDDSLQNVTDIVNGVVAQSGSVALDVSTGWGTLRLFGKTVDVNSDMLESIVGPNLGLPLLYQSWLNSGGKLGAWCPSSGDDVLDTTAISELPSSKSHESSHDHSKWAVSQNNSSSWFCGLDNNHVESQFHRSGLAVCLEHKRLSEAMRATILSADSCVAPSPPRPTPVPTPSPHAGSTCNQIGCYYVPSNPCQCNDGCKSYGDCCDDYDDVCGKAIPSPEPTPTPAPFPVGTCGGSGVTYGSCKELACTYVHKANAQDCGVDHWGCYPSASLPDACPETTLFV